MRLIQKQRLWGLWGHDCSNSKKLPNATNAFVSLSVPSQPPHQVPKTEVRHKKDSWKLTEDAAGCDVCRGTMSTRVPMPDATAQLSAKGNVPALLPPWSLRGRSKCIKYKGKNFLRGRTDLAMKCLNITKTKEESCHLLSLPAENIFKGYSLREIYIFLYFLPHVKYVWWTEFPWNTCEKDSWLHWLTLHIGSNSLFPFVEGESKFNRSQICQPKLYWSLVSNIQGIT